ncbi:MAG: alpha/beta hydrolase-fold protein [Bdellovibrionota bacterium]
MTRFFVSLSIAVLAALPAGAALECASDAVYGVPFKYCIDEEKGVSTKDVLLFFHGMGGSEKTWLQDRHQALRGALKQAGRLPKVITFSFGPNWLLTNVPAENRPALLPFFMMHILPHLEKKVGGVTGNRLLVGESMGGLNAATVSLTSPQKFKKVALLCPGIFTVGPYSTNDEIEAYIARHQPYIQRQLIEQVLAWALNEFPTDELYQQHNVIAWAARTTSGFPPYIITASTRDEFGVFEGAEAFVNVLRSRGQKPVWVPILDLPHCHPTADSIGQVARFLATP